MSKKIWVDKNGRSLGPYSEEEVLQYLRTGQLHPADASAWEGDTKWTKLSKLVAFTPPSADPSPPPEVKTQKFADTPVVVKSSQPRRTRIQPRQPYVQPQQPYVQPQQPHITVQVQQPHVQPQQPYAHPYAVPPKSKIVAFLLCFFFGFFGIHQFYMGNIGIGIIQLLTGGGCLIWAFIDLFIILCGGYTDGQRRPLQ